jgi:hypothetical protein
MSDEQVIIGDPIEPDEFSENLTVSAQDVEDAIEWWDDQAGTIFIGALEWNA